MGLEGTYGSDEIALNELGYVTWSRLRAPPDFGSVEVSYECGERYCKPLKRIERESCNQCDGRRNRTVTKYTWSGREAVVHTYRWRQGGQNNLQR